jgi:hypothetical protein
MHKKKRPRKAVSFPEMKYNYEKKKKCGEIVAFWQRVPIIHRERLPILYEGESII